MAQDPTLPPKSGASAGGAHPAAVKPPLMTALYQTGRAVDAAVNAAFAPIGLSASQWAVLRLIDEQPGIAGAEIARRSDVSPAAVTTMLDRLQSAGLVERQSQPRGRIVGAFLTEHGRHRVGEGDAIAHEVERELTRPLGREGLTRVLDDLNSFVSTLNSRDKREP
ncbi:MarR family winged helix-turn-helix transcriptional regulator [Streptomyces celluloflavus]|uniref:MarR family winged helix-turn-helix transcriptional regulator n=1 Tax=Streptomyces celluloflavus TaxID=58344 RepID=UPI0036DCC90B